MFDKSDFFNYYRAVLGRLKFLSDDVENKCGFAPQDESVPVLEMILLDLSSYECDKLVTSSLNLLTQMYFFEEELFKKSIQVGYLAIYLCLKKIVV